MADDENAPLLRHNLNRINYINSSGNYGTSTSSQEFSALSGGQPKTKTYWYRWYILGLFALIGALENITWNTWGPIEASSRLTYGWSKGTVSLLADWGAITFVLCVFPSAWLLDVKGMKCISHSAAGLFLIQEFLSLWTS